MRIIKWAFAISKRIREVMIDSDFLEWYLIGMKGSRDAQFETLT